MPTWTKNRGLSSLVAVAYVMAVTTAGLFHNHAICPGGDDCRHSCAAAHEEPSHDGHGACGVPSSSHFISASCSADEGQCPVCQFLAQKPAPAAALAPVSLCLLVCEVASPSPTRVVGDLFSAWRSRAPPAIA